MVPRRAFAIGIVVTSVAACVSIPQEVKQTFAPAGPSETSYFRRRPDAPSPQGFVRAEPAPAPAPSSPPAAPSASAPAPGATP